MISGAKLERWRQVAAVMVQDGSFRDAVHELALAFHHFGENFETPASRLRFATDLTEGLFARLFREAKELELPLTAEHVEEIVASVFLSALDLADTFPQTGKRPT